MASIKVVLRKKNNAQGLYPIAVRITKNRKSSFLFTGQYVEQKHWDAVNQRVRKSHPNSARLNNYITKKLAEANDKLLEMESSLDTVTAQTVTRQIRSARNASTFFELAKIYLEQLEEKAKFSRVNAERPRIKHFREFLKHKDVSFPEITEMLLKQYQVYLRAKRGNSERTIVNNLIVIRTLFNLAIREGIVDQRHYPFGKGGIVIRFPQSVKLGLSAGEVAKLEEVELEIEAEDHARNVWLFSFYFAGMRVSDVLKVRWSDIQDGRLHYTMGKNSKVLSLKVPDKTWRLLEYYKGDRHGPEDFIFPEMKKADLTNAKDIQRKVANGTKVLNKHLRRVAKKIELDKPLTMHIARHTFGNISGDRIPVQILQRLYRHSDITTTINYQKNFTFKEADDALDKVIGGERK